MRAVPKLVLCLRKYDSRLFLSDLIAGVTVGLVALPLLALAAFAVFLSSVTHNSVASVVGGVVLILLLQLVSTLGLGGLLDPYLLTNQFPAWLNLMRDPVDWAPIVRAAWVSLLWAIASFLAAWAVFVRRDVLS